MKRYFWTLFLCLAVVGCSGEVSQEPFATPRSATYGVNAPVTTVTPKVASAPTEDKLATAYAVIAFDQATSTAEAAATSTAYVVTATQEAKATEQFWVGVTLQVATENSQGTKVAYTQSAGTQQAAYQTAVPVTQTSIAATQIIESDKLIATRVSTWVWRVGTSVFVMGLLISFVVLLYRGIPIATDIGKELGNARVMNEKTKVLTPDQNGRFNLVPSSALKDGETLINPNLAHRTRIDPQGDDLTVEQALRNVENQRQLEAVRSVSGSPFMSKYLARDMSKQGVTPFSVRITKPGSDTPVPQPANPLLDPSDILPALPAPALPLLFSKWDGEMLPFGADEDGHLMRVDPAVRAHFMVVGRSRSGKTLSSIRPMVACLLTMGWNVVVMGKRVDFMPFEEHANFKLIAVDVRKDAQKYIDIFKLSTAQMDIRDQILYSKGKSTWLGYGAPETMFVVDDYSGAMLRMPKREATEVLNEVKSIAFDGAKYGLHLMLGLQRATWENIDTNLRSQLGRIVYSLESAGDSRVALGEDGAERLPLQFNFLTRMTDDSAIRRGVGFTLQDMEIVAFLKSRPVDQNEPLEWIEGTVKTVEEIPASVTPETMNPDLVAAYKTADHDFKIRELYLKKIGLRKRFSLRQIETEVFGSTGGFAHDTVKAVIASMENCLASEVADVLNEKFTEWKREDLATTQGATTGENAAILPDSAPVAG